MSQKTILVIEDSIDLAESIKDMLTLKNYRVLKSTTGIEGLELALTQKPDLIILDIRLPDIDGIEILKKLQVDSWGQTAKVLVITASEFNEKTIPELNLSHENIIHKSNCGADTIINSVERLLK